MAAEPLKLPMPRLPAPPRHLSASSRRLWASVVAGYDLEPRHIAVLTVAMEARDRMLEAQAAIRVDGAYIAGLHGPRSHPGIAVERDSRTAMLRAIRELGLDLEVAAAPRTPSRWHTSR